MGNSISIEQNLRDNIKLLVAQSQAYTDIKLLMVYQSIIIVYIPLIFSAISIFYGKFMPYASIFSIIASALLIVFENMFNSAQKEAARIQEKFDCSVFKLTWNEFQVGEQPEKEFVEEKYKKYTNKNGENLTKFENWYATPITSEKIPNEYFRLICQRSNCSWDSSLRKKYNYLFISISIIILITSILVSLWVNNTLAEYILIFLVPLSPIFYSIIRKIWKQYKLMDESSNIQKYATKCWNKAITNDLPIDQLTLCSRELQDALFRFRANADPIPDWFYNLFREKNEGVMQNSTSSMVEDFNQKNIKN